MYDLVFVANSTSAVKLVTEAFRAVPGGFAYAYHQAAHTSIVGIREEAEQSCCVDDGAVENWLSGSHPLGGSSGTPPLPTLFAYTAQSHMDGRRYPLSWAHKLKAAASHELYVLLDAASFAATSPLSLKDDECAPDFVAVSLYKILGFPDLGALLVRKSASHIFRHRKYFGGGTVEMIACGKEQWHVRKSESLHEQLEDGTLPIHNIIALDSALDVHEKRFVSMTSVSSHTAYLRNRLFHGLASLRHYNSQPVCVMYSPDTPYESLSIDAGPIVAFNLRSSGGEWVNLGEFEKLAGLKKIHVRTGGVCSPGGIAAALGLTPSEIRRNYASGVRCNGHSDFVTEKPTGIIRASLGAMSVESDVDRFVDFISDFYCQREAPPKPECAAEASKEELPARLEVKDIIVYPIKSCGGYHVPSNLPWRIKPEGLAWDREWCLVHEGTGQALAQKRYPKMALLKPTIDFTSDLLRITYQGERPRGVPETVTVPLSWSPGSFPTNTFRVLSSRVCGERITAQAYTSPEITNFFSSILGVPCVLTRFPSEGQGRNLRSSRVMPTKNPRPTRSKTVCIPGTFPDPPSPPESDSEPSIPLLLSNESPILVVHMASVSFLNDVLALTHKPVPAAQFRPNIIVGSKADTPALAAFSEESWRGLTFSSVGRPSPRKGTLRVLGKCYRCQMVCVDQDTGERGEEPFVTLARTRRVGGKVPFGIHVCLETRDEEEDGAPITISVADPIQALLGGKTEEG